ncbi:T9SS sorting signal type C domain-containing protein [Flavobacterium polysaccharolyticum]|uniref:T9SS sorting signal type C domain-containing protein n=1 Tax=Flavobacterium polysaccharolyticum TaxID=3133148 RepID=A0ABU9NML2_9FLAO
MKRILFFAVLLMVQLGFGQTTYYSRATGNWNSAGTWSTVSFASSTNAGTFPVAGDIVNIGGGFTITLTANASCASVTFPASALASTLAIGTNTLTVSGAVVMQAGTAAATRSISIGNSPGTLNAESITIAGANTATFVNTITVATGTINVTGDVTFNSGNQSASANLNTTGAATINIGGNLTSGTNNGRLGLNNSATWNIRGNYSFAGTLSNNNRMNLVLNGTGNQSINGINNFRRLSINKSSGTATALASIVLNNVGLDVTQGALDLSTFTHTGAGTLTVSNNAFLRVGGTASLPTFTTYTIDAGSTVEFYGGAQALTATSYGKLTLSGSGGKTFPTGTTTVNGILSIENGANANTFTGSLSYGSAATLQYNTATSRTAGAEWITPFASAGGVIIAGTGVITMNNAKTFTTNIPLTINNGASLNTNGNSLTLGGNFTRSGTFTAGSSNITISGNGIQNIAGFTTTGLVSFTKDGGKATLTSNTTGGNFSINLGAILSLGTGLVHTATGSLTLTGNPAGTVNGSWGGNGSAATNIRPSYFASATGILNVTTSTAVNAPIDNNFASYGALGEIGGTVGEYSGVLTLTAPNGTVFINTKFASYGTPNGVFPYFTIGTCHATGSRSVTTGVLGNTTASFGIGSYNMFFTPDPCVGTVKNYSVVLTYALPICSGSSPGLIDGSTPTGGTVGSPYTYVWSRSSAVNGTYTTISGATNEDYTPGALTATTFYKRTVTSGSYTDETIVIVPVIQAPTVAPTITSTCTNSTLRVAASSIPGTYVEWFTDSCGGTLYATGNEITPSSLGTYYARYRNTCGTSLCGSITITAPVNPIVITAATVPDICTSSVIQDVNLTYTYTGTAPNRYSIVWDRSIPNLLLDDIDFTITSPIVLNIPANTQAGTYTGVLTMKTSGNCISEDRIFTIKIGKAASVTSSTPVICVNSPLTITSTTTGTTSIGSATGLPSGVTASFASNIITISGTPTVSGTFNYSIPLNGTCPGVDLASGTIIVNPLPSAPIVGIITQPTCALVTGSVALSGLPSSGSWTITATPATTGLTGLIGTNLDNTVVSGLDANTSYTFVVSNGTCPSTASTAAVINAVPTTATWNGAWTGTTPAGSNPLLTQPIVFDGNYTSTGDINGCSCTVTSGNVVINSGHTMTITNAVNVTNNATTSLVFENNASLVQTTDATNTGAIEYRRISSPMKNFDFTYWSSPVTGQNIVDLSPNTLADKYFRFSGSADDWVFYNGTMVPGVGYIIRVPKPGSPAPDNWSGSTYSQPVAFKGVPNNGNYPFAVGPNELNLIGNPYPSAIRADDFINANSAIINGALYFWTHNTAITNNTYTADDYASYTLAGGTGTSKAPSTGLGGTVPDGFIAAGQSFFVENSIAGSFQFTNSMRETGNNSQFFKQANTKKTAAVEKNRVWLNLTNSKGAFKQLLVGYITGATNDWDNLYDGPSFDGQEFVDFYSTNQGKNLTIQGRALPFETTDVVPLGYRSTIAGPFDISIDNRDGALAGQEIWLEDKKTNTLHELTKGKYTFTAINGVENDRFVLKYTNKTLGTDDNEVADKSLIVSVKNKKISLTSSAEAITQVQVFDLLGRKVYDKSKINAQEWSISNLSSSEQTLIVKTTLANGAISNKKIIY